MSGKNACESIAHTINLSTFKCVQRPVPLSKCLLIAPCKTTKMPPCPTKSLGPVVPTCPPCQPLRLCTPIEARKLCKPDLCPCRPKKPPMTKSERFVYTMGFAVKCGIIAGLIWISNEQGLWSGQHEMTCLYGRILRNIRCWTGWNVGPKAGEYPEVPHLHNMTHALSEFWNKAVMGLFSIVLFIPRTLGQYFPEPVERSNKKNICG